MGKEALVRGIPLEASLVWWIFHLSLLRVKGI
jgi:hypothetical protein